jgi:TP901 family phage tail tape measure protein
VANTVTIQVDADTAKAEKSVKGMGTKFRSAMKGVAMAAGGLTLAAGAAAKLGQEYQEATNIIAAGTGASGEQLEGLEQSFRDVWGTVPQDAATVAAAIADVNTEMGLEDEALEDVTKAFLDVSRAMDEEASPMIKAVADAMIAMGEPAENTEKFLDQLTTASQAVGVPMTELADTVVKFGPQLNELGLPLTDATALIANMEAKGLDVGKMMPGLNTAIQKLAKEGVTDITVGLQDAIAEIQNAETDAEGMGLAMDLFGAGAGIRFKDAIDKGGFAIADLVEAMENSEGKVKDLGETTLTMSEKFDIMKNKVKLALSPIGNMATAIGPMVIMIPALATGISAVAASTLVSTAATWLQTAAMAALNIAMGPVGLIILAIVAAVILAIVIFKNWDKIVDTFKKTWTIVWDKIQAVFKGVVDKIKSVFDSKFGWLLPGGALLKALFLLRDNWDTIWSGMKAVVRAIANPIIGTINTVIGAVNTLFDMLRKIEIGWEEKKIGIGKFAVTLPAFNFVPFKALPTIPTIPTIAEEVTKSPTRRAMTFAGHDFPALAAGGIVKTPTLALLGERGPEAVVPLGRGGMGGITINILGPTYGFDDFEERVSEAISDGVRRGGYSGILAPA